MGLRIVTDVLDSLRRAMRSTVGGAVPSTEGSTADRPTGDVTFLFTDVEDSTRMWEHRDDMLDLICEHHDHLRSTVRRHGGRVFSTMGDGIAAVFPEAGQAVAAALDIQAALAHHDLRVRIGMHTGEAALVAGDYLGRAVNRAARVMSAAHGGQTVLSDATARAIGRDLPTMADLVELGRYRLRGLSGAERIHQLLHPTIGGEFPELRCERLGSGDRIAVAV